MRLEEVLKAKREEILRCEQSGHQGTYPRASVARGCPPVRDPRERLKDILDAIAKIERHAARGREAFGSHRGQPDPNRLSSA
jgi:hypothetical protein